MNRFLLIFSLLIYFLGCTGNDNSRAGKTMPPPAVSVNTGTIKKNKLDEIKFFSDFLKEMSSEKMIASSDEDLQQLARWFFPDSTVIAGFDLHAREIANLDTFRMVYYEYFDLYSPENEAYLGIFSPSGKALDIHQLDKVSFEGNVNINLIDQQLIEISYYDFFEKQEFGKKGLIPVEGFYMNNFEGKEDILEGYIYEYYQIDCEGRLNSISDNCTVSLNRKYPQSSARILSYSELEALSYDDILRMKNEILAEHGYIFSNQVIQKQFEKEDWYEPQSTNANIESYLTEIEKINLAKLQKLEMQY